VGLLACGAVKVHQYIVTLRADDDHQLRWHGRTPRELCTPAALATVIAACFVDTLNQVSRHGTWTAASAHIRTMGRVFSTAAISASYFSHILMVHMALFKVTSISRSPPSCRPLHTSMDHPGLHHFEPICVAGSSTGHKVLPSYQSADTQRCTCRQARRLQTINACNSWYVGVYDSCTASWQCITCLCVCMQCMCKDLMVL
jgi:hypothetical protein